MSQQATNAPHRQPTRNRVKRVVQQHQPRQQQRMTKADTSFAATMVKFIVVAFLAYALVPMSVLHWLEQTL
jgi:hypothetical protein